MEERGQFLKIPETRTAPELLAGVLRRAVAMGTFEPGERLPNERTLAERFAASRMTVRAAIRILINEGLLVTARGRNGGTMIGRSLAIEAAHPPDSFLIERFIEEVHDNFEVRLVLEPLAAELASIRASEVDRAELLDLVDREASSIRHYRMLDSRLHLVIARASGNQPLMELVERLRTDFFLWADTAWVRLDWAVLTPSEQDFGSSHRELVRSIVDGNDPDLACTLMRNHLEEGLRQVKTVLESVVQSKFPQTSANRSDVWPG